MGRQTVRRVLLTAVTTVAALGAVPGPAWAAPQQWNSVVVTGPGADTAVRAAGGRVVADLALVDGVAAELPYGTVLGPQWTVAPSRSLTVASTPTTGTGATGPVRAALGLPANGTEGSGVTVAVVDTGVADVPDLAGRVTDRVDFSGTGAGDGFGHGTFMAGLIASSGAASGGKYRGAAPGASLVDVKVADAAGQTDLVTVLRGLEWVADHAKDVDVVNLSLSSSSPLPYQLDPLTQALEALWRKGITVVVPAGNDGPGAGTITSPGIDPVLLTAGGLDASGTAAASWSAQGPTWQGDAKPDLLAPGTSLVSLRSPGSTVDTANPSARVGDGYFVGSGTSMATAVTSAVAADALAVSKKLTPGAVKDLLTQGGTLDAAAVLAAAPKWKTSTQDDADTAALRGDAKKWAAFAQAMVAGDRAAAYAAWQKLSQASKDWAGRAWASLDPATRAWAGRAWAGRAWAGLDGTADEWLGRAWAGRAWAGRAWADADWAGRAWAGRAWADSDWAGRAWADSQWAGADWSGRAWAGRAWASDTWAGRAWAWLP